MQQRFVNRAVLLLVLAVISAIFYQIIKPFLLAIFIAALFAALFTPLYKQFLHVWGNRPSLASISTLITVLCFVFVPLFFVGSAVLTQALDIAQSAKPWVQEQFSQPGALSARLEALPFYEQFLPHKATVLQWLGDFTGMASKWAIDAIQSATLGTVNVIITGLIVLYTMFFFLMDGDKLLYYLLYYLPLNDDDETKLLHRFTSVTRATLKGTAVIGMLQGAMAGAALSIAGIPSGLFWAVVMMFLSVVPGIGTALVWVPAVIYLAVSGEVFTAVVVFVFCLLVVGSVDNLLRPKLIGNDTQLHELMIFFSTLGGLMSFGFMGFVIGPIVAALFVTIWELYGYEFSDWLPTTAFTPRSGPVTPPHQKLVEAMQEVNQNEEEQPSSASAGEEHTAAPPSSDKPA